MKPKTGAKLETGNFYRRRSGAPGTGIIFYWKTEKSFCFRISAESRF